MQTTKKTKVSSLAEQEASSTPYSQNPEVEASSPSLPKKKEEAKFIERLFYLISAAFAPCIPLFFLYNQNADEGILFTYCLILGLALAVLSVIAYIVMSLILRKRAASLIVVSLIWVAFWYFKPLHKLFQFISGGSMSVTTAVALAIIIILTIILALVRFNKIATNTVALILCMLFMFNFVPAIFTAIKFIPTNVEKSYEIKSSFNVDNNLPQPNIYWLHMDGMLGFSAFEEYFNDPQTELKSTLNEYGFVINETAEMGGAGTLTSVPALMSPTFFDTWLSEKYEQYADFTRNKRQSLIKRAATNQDFDFLVDVFPKAELMKALSDAGYNITGNKVTISLSEVADLYNDGKEVVFYDNSKLNTEKYYIQFRDFQNLIVDASALTIFCEPIDSYFNEITPTRPTGIAEKIPPYDDTVEKYLLEDSDSEDLMKEQIRAVKYAIEMENPTFLYLNDMITHCFSCKTLGRVFNLDENGNRINLKEKGKDSIYNLKQYFPQQYKYGVKQLMAKVDVIIENDPDAIIIIQADHGIHCLGPLGTTSLHEGTMEKQGYSVEDMQNLNKSVFSAVRIPEKYGKLTEPLEPVDIARYIVNHYVGEGNYDYLYYNE